MEEKAGFERPGFFLTDGTRCEVPKYDFYGSYGHERNTDRKYEETLAGDFKFEFSDHHEIVKSLNLNLLKYFKVFLPRSVLKFVLVARMSRSST